MLEWKDYSDANPLTEGGIWVAKDTRSNDVYHVVRYEPTTFIHGKKIPSTQGATIYILLVNISDEWIEQDMVCQYSDIKDLDTEESKERYAIACTEYHSIYNFGESYVFQHDELDTACDTLRNKGIMTIKKCPDCKGQGKVLDDESCFFFDEEVYEECPTCKGQRIVTTEKYDEYYKDYPTLREFDESNPVE